MGTGQASGVVHAAGISVDLVERAAVALASPLPLVDVLDLLAGVAREATGASACTISLGGPDGYRPVAVHGHATRLADDSGGHAVAAGRPVLFHVADAHDGVPPGGAQELSVATVGLVPVQSATGADAVASLDWCDRLAEDDERAVMPVLSTLAAWLSIALDSAGRRDAAVSHDRRARWRALGARAAEQAMRGRTAAVLARRLDALLGEEGVAVVGVAMADPLLRRALRAERLTQAERARWRAGSEPVAADGVVAVPIRQGRQLLAALRIRCDGDVPTELDEVTAALGTAFQQSRLALVAELAADERATSAEWAALVRDAAGDAAELLSRFADLARQGGDGEALARLAEQGRMAIADALDATQWVPSPDQRLLPALRSLVRLVRDRSGLPVTLRVSGHPVWLAPQAERLLYRAAYETITMAWRHARANVLCVDLVYDDGSVHLLVTDDGTAPDERAPHRGGYERLLGLVTAGGGRLSIDRVDAPRGLTVEVELPAGRPPIRRHL